MRKVKKDTQPRVLLAALGLAALGQVFLVRQETAWTLFPGLALFGAAAFLWARSLSRMGPGDRKEQALSPRLEAALFLGILLVALFFRAYHLGQYPPGLYSDAARQGYGALRILHEGWGPFQEPDLYLGGSLSSGFYELALWFRFFPATPLGLLWGSVTLSLLAFPFLYWFFRQLAGARVALTALFLFGVMRWDVTYAQGAHPAVDYPFYLFGTLACWLATMRIGSRWAFGAFILFAAGGCYSYEAFVAVFPALAVLGSYEYRRDPSVLRRDLGFRAGGVALFVALTLPAWKLHWARGGFGAVYDRMRMLAPGTPPDLGTPFRLLNHLLMYNRHGDLWFYHNIPGHRMLDDGTGLLWVLGLAMALVTFRKPASFYSLVPWAFLALPAILSPYPPHASRALGCAGFVAFFAALSLTALARNLGPFLSKTHGTALLLGLGLVPIAALNAWTYFGVQARDLSVWRDEGWAATRAGERIGRAGDDEVYVAPRFFRHYDVLFQSYGRRLHPFPGAEDLPKPSGKGMLFVLDEGKAGTLEWMREIYPGGGIEKALDQDGRPMALFYRVPPGIPAAALEAYQRSAQGLTASYYFHGTGKGGPDLTRREALINFTFRGDFPAPDASPFTAHWSGTLVVPATGPYRFLGLTTDDGRLFLDGKKVWEKGTMDPPKVRLKKGPHRLELDFVKAQGKDAALSLLWQGPGEGKYGIVPASAYRTGTTK